MVFEDETILITGGGGSIATELCNKLLQDYNPRTIRIFDISEQNLYKAQERFGTENVRYLLGDVRDLDMVRLASRGADTIFHMAAIKHVPIANYAPEMTIQTNVNGTLNVVKAALNTRTVKTVLNTSTDKASNPVSIYGSTKKVAEEIIIWGHRVGFRNSQKLFINSRFGNVMFSSNSVLPFFKRMIDEGKRLEVRDTRMKRFFMTMEEATEFIIEAIQYGESGALVVPKMPVVEIYHLAKLFNELNRGYGIDITQPVVGEKLDEDLLTATESINRKEYDNKFVISSRFFEQEPIEYSTRTVEPLSKKGILKLLKKSKPEEYKSFFSELDV